MQMRKSFLAAALLALSGVAASGSKKCIKERVSNVPNGWVHSRPELSIASDLWELTAGSTVTYCGRWKARKQPIIWHWVSFRSVQEPWNHEGWMPSLILDPAAPLAPQTTLPDEPPQSTLPAPPPVELQGLPDHPSPPPVEPPRSTLSGKPATPDKTPASAETCKTDWRKCSDNADLINNYIDEGGHTEVHAKCEEAINGLSKYGTPSWPSFGKFDRGFDDPKTGIVAFYDDSVTFKNMFNADVHMTVICVYDLNTNTVKSFHAFERD